MKDAVEESATNARKGSTPSEYDGDGEVARQLKSWDVVAFIGLLTFVTTLAFEYGRAAYWQFPASFVRFTPENAFIVFVKLAIAALFVGLVTQVARLWKWYRVVVSLLSALLVIVAMIKIADLWGGLAPLALFVGAAYAVAAVVVLFQADAKQHGDPPWLIRAFGKGGVALSAAMVAIPYAAVALGFIIASDQEEFVVTTNEPRRILLAAYGSDGVFAVLNGSQESGFWIAKEFLVHGLSDDGLGALRTVQLGHVGVGAP